MKYHKMKNETRKLLIHSIGCLIFLSLPILSSPDFNTGQNLFRIQPFLISFSRNVLILLYFYLNFYLFLPKLYFSEKKLVFAFLTVICFLMVMEIPELAFPFEMRQGPPDFEMGRPPRPESFLPFHMFEGGFFQFLFVFFLSFLLKINSRFDEMKSEKQSAEISYLKAQINPHFLFNTLNSLYALTIIKSDDAPNAVLKLSGMMRYVVTESSQDFVPLEKEINYIKDYIELQKLRMDESTQFSFIINGTPFGKAIAPLVLIPFIENAFKYGLNPEEESEISIVLEILEKSLILEVQNKMVVDELPEEMKSEKGIENTTKRLEFIYPNRHTLVIKEEKNTYCVSLNLELA